MLYPILVQDVASMSVGCDLARWIECRFIIALLSHFMYSDNTTYCMAGEKKESLPWSKETQHKNEGVSTEVTYGRFEFPRILVFAYPS